MQKVKFTLQSPGKNGFKTYWATGRGADSKRHRFSLGTTSKREAEARLAKIVAEQTQELLHGPRFTFAKAVID